MVFEILPLCGFKVAARLRALKRVTGVDQPVCLQLALVGCGKAADVAQVVLGGAVCHHVILQSVLPLEAIATHLADKWLLCHVFRQMCAELCACFETHVARVTEVRQRVCVLLKVELEVLCCVQLHFAETAYKFLM